MTVDYFTGASHGFRNRQLLDEINLLVRQLVEFGGAAPTLPDFDRIFPFRARFAALTDQRDALRAALAEAKKKMEPKLEDTPPPPPAEATVAAEPTAEAEPVAEVTAGKES